MRGESLGELSLYKEYQGRIHIRKEEYKQIQV